MEPLDSTEQAAYPEVLPGNEVVLITVIPCRTHAAGLVSATATAARIDAVNVGNGERRTLLRGGGAARYSITGHLLYGAGGTLSAVPFDAARPELVGAGGEVVQDAGSSELAVASNGTLVYVSGGTSGSSTMVWVDRQGRDRQLEAPPKWYLYPRLSPDRTRVAVNIAGTDRDVWIWDIQSKSLERLTRDPADDATLIWTRDGREILFGSARFRGVPNIFIQPADGSEDARRVLESSQTQQPIRFAPDGRLIFSQEIPGRSRDILALTLDGTRAVQSLVHTTGADATGDVSPDSGGGKQPRWSDSGAELFYRDLASGMGRSSDDDA